MPERRYSSPYLCDLTQERIGVECATCGMVRSYDRRKLMARLEDFDHQCIPSLLGRLARGEGCPKAQANQFGAPCGLTYDAATRLA